MTSFTQWTTAQNLSSVNIRITPHPFINNQSSYYVDSDVIFKDVI